jgi:hypothetical protein
LEGKVETSQSCDDQSTFDGLKSAGLCGLVYKPRPSVLVKIRSIVHDVVSEKRLQNSSFSHFSKLDIYTLQAPGRLCILFKLGAVLADFTGTMWMMNLYLTVFLPHSVSSHPT